MSVFIIKQTIFCTSIFACWKRGKHLTIIIPRYNISKVLNKGLATQRQPGSNKQRGSTREDSGRTSSQMMLGKISGRLIFWKVQTWLKISKLLLFNLKAFLK